MRNSLRKKSNQLFAQIAAIGLAIVLLLAGLLFKIYNYTFSSVGEFMLNKAHIACGCETIVSGKHTTLFGLISFIGIAILLTILIAIFRIVFSLFKTRSFIRNQKSPVAQISPKLAQIADLIGISKRVVEIGNDKPIIFCHGITQPKICVSSGVVKSLSFMELRAVLLHETQHLISKEPARLLVIKFINTFRFIPGIKNLTKKYISFSELAADELATNNFTDKTNLARAMKKILELEEKTIIQNGLALSYFTQITEERVNALSDNNYQPTFRREIIKTIFGITIAAALFFYFGSEIQAQTNNTKQLTQNSPCVVQHQTEECENGMSYCDDNKVFHADKVKCDTTIKYFQGLKK